MTKKSKQRDTPIVSSSGKKKLRTAADVISRLRWSKNDDAGSVLIGYDDRIHGPMETPLEDYVRIDQGGDLPEHRIQYFRTADDATVLWDRLGRVDRIFDSGNGADAPVDPKTEVMIVQAIANMARLEEEKRVRRAKREQERTRRARQRARYTPTIASNQVPTLARRDRYSWRVADWYEFSNATETWTEGSVEPRTVQSASENGNGGRDTNDLVLVTWNVLFDLYNDEELDANDVSPLFIYNDETTQERWELLVNCLERTNPDLVALQEVTPGFAKLLASQPWIQSGYASSAAANPLLDSVDPWGNLLLWRKDKLRVMNKHSPHMNKLSLCQDGPRKRAVVAALQLVEEPSTVVLCANVHLPADKPAGERIDSRDLARQRELLAVVGRLQAMEQQIVREVQKEKGAATSLIPVLVGDFNTEDEMMKEYFVDPLPKVSISMGRSFTFDPETNVRASKSKRLANSKCGPRTIDRILVAKGLDNDDMLLKPLGGALVGVADDIHFSTPPSDHYGLRISFCLSDCLKHHPRRTLLQRVDGQSAWASHAASSPDTLLALVLNDTSTGPTELFDSSSSLSVPHVTLLHGFVELDSQQNRRIATQAVERAVRLALSNKNGKHKTPYWSLLVSQNSFSVFEHRNSATLVCLPDTDCDEGIWLPQLYDALKGIFCLCRDQEDRFQDGWTPHLSLASYGTAASARSEIGRIISAEQWVQDNVARVETHAIGLFQRDPNDGKFYAVSSVPLEPNPKEHRINDFLEDAGRSWSIYMRGLCTPALMDLERACQQIIDKKSQYLKASIQGYGSHAMEASLPGISDVDAVIVVQPRSDAPKAYPALRAICSRSLFSDLIYCLKSRYRGVKARLRWAGESEGRAGLNVLTVKLWPLAPLIDLQLCLLDVDSELDDKKSCAAFLATRDNSLIVETAKACSKWIPVELDAVRVFQGALRIVKLWAHNRQVYGTRVGYVGGGGWAVMLATVMYDSVRDRDLMLAQNESHAQASARVVAHFFRVASGWVRPFVVTLPLTCDTVEKDIVQQSIDSAMIRNTMAVPAPASGGNFGRNTIPCTVSAITDELKRATAIVNSTQDLQVGLEQALCPLDLYGFVAGFGSTLTVEIEIPDQSEIEEQLAANVKGCASVFVLGITFALEHLVRDPSRVRPRTTPIRVGRRFVFLIGCDFKIPQQQVDDFCSKRSQLLKVEYRNAFGPVHEDQGQMTQIQFLDSPDALSYLRFLLE